VPQDCGFFATYRIRTGAAHRSDSAGYVPVMLQHEWYPDGRKLSVLLACGELGGALAYELEREGG
jgi:hypothetical protein